MWAGKATGGTRGTGANRKRTQARQGARDQAGKGQGEQGKTGPRNGGHRRKAPGVTEAGPAGQRGRRAPRGAGSRSCHSNVSGPLTSAPSTLALSLMSAMDRLDHLLVWIVQKPGLFSGWNLLVYIHKSLVLYMGRKNSEASGGDTCESRVLPCLALLRVLRGREIGVVEGF